MPYQSPGVYKEQIFLQPQPDLPTGIPGFVGFADAIAPLAALPSGFQFPESLQDKVQYDRDPLRPRHFSCRGSLSVSERDLLLAVSSDPAVQQAISALFQAAQPVVSLRHPQEFINQFSVGPTGYLKDAVTGFFENGGTRCFVVRAATTAIPEDGFIQALTFLESLEDLDLVAVPDAMTLPSDAVLRVQQAVLTHCARAGDRLAILDPLPNSSADAVRQQRQQILLGQPEPINAALYYPWLHNAEGRLLPPCGHIAGVVARSDRDQGVFKAPANVELRDVLDLEQLIDNTIQDQLNPNGINCLRSFPGRGIRVWGARTLSSDANWRYINVRRLFLTLGRWIDRNMTWATFEPNSPRLWIRIQRELSIYLAGLWRVGALQGAIAEQSFYVKCDAETNPPDSRETGVVYTEIGLAASPPAEFIIVRIIHRISGVEVT
jgi:uncharacterized protein